MNCRDCLHYEACRDVYDDLTNEYENYGFEFDEFDEKDYGRVGCVNFTARSEWVHLPSDEYTFTVRGDIAKGLIISNCRAAERSIGNEQNRRV